MFDPEGRFVDSMDKIHLVPFGERVPFSDVFPLLRRVDFGEADFSPGERYVVFRPEDWRFANLICFEAIFPRLTRRYLDEGVRLFVNITNDSWFGAGAGAEQHADMARVRCVETGCGMARCANSGISMGVDRCGRALGRTDLFVRQVAVVDVPLRVGETVFGRTGDWPAWGAGLAAVALALAAVLGLPRRAAATDSVPAEDRVQ